MIVPVETDLPEIQDSSKFRELEAFIPQSDLSVTWFS